jgi:hypothetical protein
MRYFEDCDSSLTTSSGHRGLFAEASRGDMTIPASNFKAYRQKLQIISTAVPSTDRSSTNIGTPYPFIHTNPKMVPPPVTLTGLFTVIF